LLSQPLEFPPEPDYMRIYSPWFNRYLRPPHVTQEFLTIKYPSGATKQLLQQPEFNTGEKNRMRIKGHSKGLWMKNKIPHTVTRPDTMIRSTLILRGVTRMCEDFLIEERDHTGNPHA
jgi:hypothetical protein